MSQSAYTYTDSEYDDMVDPLSPEPPPPRPVPVARSTRSTPTPSVPDEEQPRSTALQASPKKPPRPASMASTAVPMNGSTNGSNIALDDIQVTPQPRYEIIEPRYADSTFSEPPQTTGPAPQQPRPGASRDPSPYPTSPRPDPTPAVRTQPQTTPHRPGTGGGRRYDPPRAGAGRSEPDGPGRGQPAPADKEDFGRKKRDNQLKAATKPIDDDYNYENSFMQRFKRPIMLVMFLLLVALSIAIGIGARNASMVSITGAFSSNLGDDCRRLCRHGEKYPTPPLVVIALGGFQSNFFKEKALLRNMARLAECGVHGETTPSYPSTTLPNLYSIITGIHPAFHGKAGDWLTAYEMNETESGPASQPANYSGIDPGWFQRNGLWGVAADHGLLTASHSWMVPHAAPGQNAPVSPSYYQEFDSGVSYKNRMQTVLNWLHLDKEERPQLITVYFEDPGKTAKQYGLTSKQTMDSLAGVDSALGHLLDALYEEMDLGCVNILVVSTGGLSERNCDSVYYLKDDIRNVDDFALLPDTVTTVGKITATDESPRNMNTPEEILEHLQCKVDHGQAFTSPLLPVQLHSTYPLNRDDVVVIMDEGWTFAKQQEEYDRNNCKGASDGYIPFSKMMQGMFVGFGKSFKMGKSMPAVKNVDLYNLMTELLSVSARANNGTAGILSDALLSPKSNSEVAMEFIPPMEAECVYPADNEEYVQRTTSAEAGCTCPQKQATFLRRMDTSLLTNVSYSDSIQQNAPFGLPKVMGGQGSVGQDYCHLFQRNFITAFENKLKLPIYGTFTARRNSATLERVENCLRYDVRLMPENSPKCSSYDVEMNLQLPLNIVPALLYDPALADTEENQFNALTSANIVPQYSAFRDNVWLPLTERIREWANQRNGSSEMNVVLGPVYDWNADTHRDAYHEVATSIAWVLDTPLPSHFFLVASRCSEEVALSMCPLQQLQVLSMVLPNTNSVRICQTLEDYLSVYLTSLQDVELITGLQFLPDMNSGEDLQVEMLRFKSRRPTLEDWLM